MKFLAGILAVVAIYGVRQYITDSYTTTMAAVAKGGPASCLQMLGSTTAEEDGRTYLVGSIRNNCERRVGQVTVVFSMEHAGSSTRDTWNPSSTVYAYVRDIDRGETRRFKSAFSVPNDRTFRFDRINAF
jgi:hypothetical protein